MMKRVWKISSLKYLAAFLVPLILVMFVVRSLDNDSWFLLAEGREIVNNGVFYTDPLSMHEGLNIVAQQYGFAAIFYVIFEIFGAPGLYLMMLVLTFAIEFLLYKICMLLSNKNVNLSLLIMVVTVFLLALCFVATRPQMVSYVILLALVYVLELYVKTDKAKYLAWIPLLSVLQINLHASVWWMLILVLLVYIIDAIKKPKLHFSGYRMKPLILVTIVAIMCGFINPYGAKMVTFIFTSYGNATINDLVSEMQPFVPISNVFSTFTYIGMAIVLFLYIFGKKENVRVRYLLMFFGFLFLGMNTSKGLGQFVLLMFVPMALMYKNVRLEKVIEAKKGRDVLMVWAGVVAVAIFVAMCPAVVSKAEGRPDEALVGAIDIIDADIGDKERAGLKIYTGYNDGGYAEWRGYKTYLDPRAEVFLEKNNGKEDILKEWVELRRDKSGVDEFLEKYEFDYILLRGEADPLYNLNDERYEKIFWDEEMETGVLKRI